jgi:hypothetical protein
MITTSSKEQTRLTKHDRVQIAFAQMLAEATRRGTFGAATLSFNVQDGAIQQIRVAIERSLQ